jgi:hypothetical protein
MDEAGKTLESEQHLRKEVFKLRRQSSQSFELTLTFSTRITEGCLMDANAPAGGFLLRRSTNMRNNSRSELPSFLRKSFKLQTANIGGS